MGRKDPDNPTLHLEDQWINDEIEAHASSTALSAALAAEVAARQAALAALPGTYGPDSLLAKALRWRSRPGSSAIPTVMAAPYTTTTTAVTGATLTSVSTVTGAVHVPPDLPGAFCVHGSPMVAGPLVSGSIRSLIPYGATTGPQTSPSPYVVEFMLDTVGGSFDFCYRNSGTTNICRMAVDGQYLSAGYTSVAPGTSAGPVLFNVAGLAAGQHRIRIECASDIVWAGANIGPTDGLRAVPRPRGRLVVAGDSFTEPTIVESTSGYMRWGWVQTLGLILGVEAISSGSGGTGYLNPGSGGRVKVRDRLTNDVIALNPDYVIWAVGGNDYSGHSAAAIGAEATLCYSTLTAALPYCQQIVLSPVTALVPKNMPVTFLAAKAAIAASATAAGLPFVDLCEMGSDLSLPAASTLQADAAGGATTVSSGMSVVANGAYVKIGPSGAQETRLVTGVSGSGPYTLTLESALTNAHSSGEAIVAVGGAWVTGDGRQGATSGAGTRDRYIGNDSAHPTSDLPATGGHRALAFAVARQLAAALRP